MIDDKGIQLCIRIDFLIDLVHELRRDFVLLHIRLHIAAVQEFLAVDDEEMIRPETFDFVFSKEVLPLR